MADLSNAFKSIRLRNDTEISVSYISREISVENGIENISLDVTNAKLYPYMYDATTISIQNIPRLEIGNSDFMNRCWLTIVEMLGEQRYLTFNLGTRLDKYGDPVSLSVFYDQQFTYNREENRYELSIYVPAKCSDGTNIDGFDDSYVLFECTEPVSNIPEEQDPENPYVPFSISGQYITALPPLIVQGEAKKIGDEEDSVFPEEADRCDIGEGTIPCYYENSQGYTTDYLFTNGEPVYRILTSGFIPISMKDQISFQNVTGYLMDEMTGSINSLPTALIGEPSEKTMNVLQILDGQSQPMTGDFEVSVWETQIKNDWAQENKTTIKNVVTVSAAVQRL